VTSIHHGMLEPSVLKHIMDSMLSEVDWFDMQMVKAGLL